MVATHRRRHTDVLTRPIANIPSAELVTRRPADWDNDVTAVETPAANARSKRTRIAVIRDEPAKKFTNDYITYACPCSEGNACLRCDAGTAVAAVTLETVNIGSITYDRGGEDEERIAEALELVDDEHRERLEWLLRNGPAEDADALVVEVSAPMRAPVVLLVASSSASSAPQFFCDVALSEREAAQELQPHDYSATAAAESGSLTPNVFRFAMRDGSTVEGTVHGSGGEIAMAACDAAARMRAAWVVALRGGRLGIYEPLPGRVSCRTASGDVVVDLREIESFSVGGAR